MITVQQIRRENLGRLLVERFDGNLAALSRACEKTAPLFSDVLANPPRKGFGERLARSIEEKLSLPSGWLDGDAQIDLDPALSPAEDLFLLSVRASLKKKAVPAHVMQTILFLLEAAPDKP